MSNVTDKNAGILDDADVAALLKCSKRHVARMVKAKLMPAPAKLGRLNRWARETIEQWIAQGGKIVREGAGS